VTERDRLAVRAAIHDFELARQPRTTVAHLFKIIDENNCIEVVQMLPPELVDALRAWAGKDWSRPLHDARGPMSDDDAARFRAKVSMIRAALQAS
jgi:hypothetical protein